MSPALIPGIVASSAGGGKTFTLMGTAQVTDSGATHTITTADLGGYTPQAGDLLVVALELEDEQHGGVTSSSGMTKRLGVNDASAANGSASWWDKVLSAGETSWVFNLTNDISVSQAYALRPSSGIWTFDKSSTAAPAGTGTTVVCPSTGVLTTPDQFAVAAAQRATSPSGDNSIDSGFTTLNPTQHFRGCGGYKITTSNTALAPTISWASGAVLRCGGVATWYLA